MIVEKFGEFLNENLNGMILIRDELVGFFSKFLKEDSVMERVFYFECFDGFGCFIYDCIGRGIVVIDNVMMSLIGGI